MYSVQVQKFTGPLDLLLDLIEQEKMSVNEIALAEVSDQYFTYIKNLENFPKKEVADFLVVAATLMLIKSRSLLPGFNLERREEEDVAELELRLEMLRTFRKLSRNISGFIAAGHSAYFRERLAGFEGGFYPPKKSGIGVFADVMRAIIDKIPAIEELPEKTIERIVTIEEKMAELINRITSKATETINTFVSSKNKQELIVTFLAMLELLKQGLIAVKQEGDFGEIKVSKS